MSFFKKKLDAQVLDLKPMPVVMLTHTGSYDALSEKFDQLWAWVEAKGVPAKQTIGIYWDNPDYTAQNALRSAACVEIPVGFQLPATDGLPLQLFEIPGGTYVTLRHVGPYDQLASVWKDLTKSIERDLQRTISEKPAFEIYVNDPSDTAPRDLITELYMPIV